MSADVDQVFPASTVSNGSAPLLDVTYLIEYVLVLELCQGTALNVSDSTELLCHPFAHVLGHRLHLLLRKLLPYGLITSQIYLCADYEAWDTRTMMVDLREPLFPHVLKRSG